MLESEKRLESRTQLWALLGPAVILLTFVACLSKPSFAGIYLPIAALLGMILCWLYRMKGLLVGLAFIGAYLIFNYKTIPSHERLWHLGLVLALGLGMVITALSLEEIASVLRHYRLQQLLGFDKSRELEMAFEEEKLLWQEEKRRALAHFKTLQAESLSHQEALNLLQQSYKEQTEALLHYQSQCERQCESLSQIRSEYANQSESFKFVKAQFHNLQTTYDQLQAQERGRQQSLEQERIILENNWMSDLRTLLEDKDHDLIYLNEKLLQTTLDLEELKKELKAAVVTPVEPLVISPSEPLVVTFTAVGHATENEPLDEQIVYLKSQEALYKQLRKQFQEKSEVLHQARVQIFKLEGQLHCCQRQQQEEELEGVEITHMAALLAQAVSEKSLLEKEVVALQELISHLMDT